MTNPEGEFLRGIGGKKRESRGGGGDTALRNNIHA